MTGDKVKQLEKLCRPVVKFLQDNCSPHETVIITDSSFKMTSDVAGMPLDNPYKGTKSAMQKAIEEYINKAIEKKRHENKTPFDSIVNRMLKRSRQ